MSETTLQPGSGAAIKAAAARIADPEQRVLERIAEIRKRKPSLREDAITMSHGAGGKASHTLITALFGDILSNPVLDQLGDQAVIALPGVDHIALAVTTDSFVVSPLFFPGGDIGELAVNGTINDLAVGGATPLGLSAAFILEEGLDVATLRRVVESVRRAADRAGVSVVTGDTKVVPRGKADQLFITTTGVGIVPLPQRVAMQRVAPGDVVVLSGAIGDHGSTVMLARGDVDLEADALRSDTMALHGLTAALLEAGIDVHFMRDATRGGVATVLNEIAQAAGVAVAIDEASLPIHDEVRGVCGDPRDRPALHRQRGQARGADREGGRRTCPRPDAETPGGNGGGDHRRGPRRTRRHGVHPHRVRWHQGGRHAHRRPAAAHLLSEAQMCGYVPRRCG